MALDENFEKNFDNRILVKINNKLDIDSDEPIILDKEDFSLEIDTFKNFQRFQIIDEYTNKLNLTRYNYFRNYMKGTPIDGITGTDIIKLIDVININHFSHKDLKSKIPNLGFGKVPEECILYNYNKLSIRSCIEYFGKELYNKLKDEAEADKIKFNKKNGEVFKNEDSIGFIPLNTKEFEFFEFLFNHINTAQSHNDIKTYLIGGDRISSTTANYLSGIKKKLKTPIKALIGAPTGHYILK